MGFPSDIFRSSSHISTEVDGDPDDEATAVAVRVDNDVGSTGVDGDVANIAAADIFLAVGSTLMLPPPPLPGVGNF